MSTQYTPKIYMNTNSNVSEGEENEEKTNL